MMNRDLSETQQDDLWRKVEAVEATLAAKKFWLSFPPEIEAQFERDTSRQRRRSLAILSLLAVICFNLFGFADRIALSDIIPQAMLIRHGIFTVGGVALAAAIYFARNAHLREGLAVLSGVWSAGILLALVSLSESPLRVDYLYGVIPLVMYVILVKRVRFAYALAVAAGILAIHLFMMAEVRHLTALPSASTGLVVTTALLTLIAGYTVEREYRRNYLTALRERLHREGFETLSLSDPLTELGNRRALEVFLGDLKADKTTRFVSVVFGDIDHFKTYNDTFGHVAGDECLRLIAGRLPSAARSGQDRFFRYGGEEFVAVLPGCNEDQAAVVAERMRLSVMMAGIEQADSVESAVVTMSFGVAGMATDRLDVEFLFERADTALYLAKHGGRNCVRCAENMDGARQSEAVSDNRVAS